MIYPSADIIEEKVKSRYSLVILAAKRAKQIKEGAPVLIDTDSTNPLTIALEEIAAGKVTVIEAPGEIVPQTATPGGTTARIMNWQSDDAEDTGETGMEDGSAL